MKKFRVFSVAICLLLSLPLSAKIEIMPDREVLGFKGAVKDAYYTDTPLTEDVDGEYSSPNVGAVCYRISFSPSGQLTSFMGYNIYYDAEGKMLPNDTLDVMRDSQGRIVRLRSLKKIPNNKVDLDTYIWRYDARGHLVGQTVVNGDQVMDNAFFYDRRGELGCASASRYCETIDMRFKIISTDAYGNWTHRVIFEAPHMPSDHPHPFTYIEEWDEHAYRPHLDSQRILVYY